MEVLADILQNSNLDEARIEREREVILREMEEVEGQSEEVIFDHLHATAFQYTSLGRPILGSADNVRSITKEDLENYIATHYTASRMVITAAGNVKHEDIVAQANKLFNKLSTDPTTTSMLVAKEPASFTGSEVRIIDDDMPLAQFAVAFNGASWVDPDSVALMVMQSMLGSWNKNAGGGKHMGSELVQRAAINDIAESVMAFNTNYKDTGLFGVYAVAKADCLDDLAFAIMQEMSKLSYRVTEEDVIRARNQLKSSIQLHLDGSTAVVEDIGRQMLTYGRRIPIPELFARIDAVDASTVKRVANRFIFDQDVAIAAMGPIQGLPDYNWFRRRTYMLRY
jgi:processing peptidase subunit beta